MTRPAQHLLMALAFDVYWTLVVMLRERGLLIWLTLAIFAWLSYQPARPGHMALHHAEQRRRSHRSDRIPVLPTQRRWS